MSLRRCQTLRWGWLLVGLCSLYAAPAAAEHLKFISDLRMLWTPNLTITPSTSFGFFYESRSDSSFHVSQASSFPTDRFVGNGSASAPPFEPNVEADPGAASEATFTFSIADSTDVRIEATLNSSGHAASTIWLYLATFPFTTLFTECAGYFCPGMTTQFPEEKTVDTVLTLAPGSYKFFIESGVEAQDNLGPDQSSWSVRLSSPPAVPVAGWTRVGMITSLMLAGLAGIRRRNLHPLRQ